MIRSPSPLRAQLVKTFASALDAVGNAVPGFVAIGGTVAFGYCMIMVIIAGGAVLIVAASVAVVGTVALKSRRSGRGRAPAGRVGQGLIHAATALLPGEVGARYGEEWSGELIALQDEGAGRSALARYVTGILLKAVPVLAISLRLHRSRAVE